MGLGLNFEQQTSILNHNAVVKNSLNVSLWQSIYQKICTFRLILKTGEWNL